MSYTPSPLLDWFHRVPRYDYNLRSVPSQLDGGVSATNPYILGVAMQGGGLVAFGILMFLVFGIALAVSRLCCRSSKAGRGVCCCCRPTCYSVLSLLTCICVAAAMYLFSTWRSGLTDVISALKAFSGVLSSAAAALSGPLTATLTALSTDTQALQAACLALNQTCTTDLQASIATVLSQVQSTQATVSSASSTLSSSASGFTRSLGLASDSSFRLDAIQAGLDQWVWVVLGVVIGWLLLHLVTLLPSKATACLFRLSTVCTLLLALAVPVLAGALYAVAMVGADVCVAPTASVTRLLNNTAPLAASSFAFYATCTSSSSSSADSSSGDALSQVAAASSGLLTARAQLLALNASVQQGITLGGAQLATLYAPIDAISADLDAANATVLSLSSTTLGCAPVSSIYYALLNALCGKAVTGVAETFFPIVLASVLFFLILCYAVSLCAHHAGDGGGGGEEEGASGPGGLLPPEDRRIRGSTWGGQGFRPTSPKGRAGQVSEWGGAQNPAYASPSRYQQRQAY